MIALAYDRKPSHPILLGDVGDIQYESHVELPKGYSPELPGNSDLKQDFAEYHVSYAVKGAVLITDRHLVVKLSEVPLSEYDAFKKFVKAVGDDHEMYVALSSGDSPTNSLQNAIARLPGSENPEAPRAYDDALAAAHNNNTQGAINFLKHAMEADPHFIRARMWLSGLYGFSGQKELALEELRKAYEEDPRLPVTYKALVASLLGTQKYEEAVAILQDEVKRNPEDAEAFSSLSFAFTALKRFADAADADESVIKLRPNQSSLYERLGFAYLHAGNEERSLAAYKRAVEIDPRARWFNDAGYELADANKQLPLALEYAGRAVREEEESSAKVMLSDLKKEGLAPTSALAAYWDTLGWVYFRMGILDKAEKYLNAGWLLSQSPTIGDHLAQVYEKQHRREQAVNLYGLALYRFSLQHRGTQQSDEEKASQARLEHLSPGSSSDLRSIPARSDALSRVRTFKMPRAVTKQASAEFFVLLAAGPKPINVKFISGSEELKSSESALRAIDFKPSFPDDGPAHLLRRGILSCYQHSGCSFVLYNLEDVRSVN